MISVYPQPLNDPQKCEISRWALDHTNYVNVAIYMKPTTPQLKLVVSGSSRMDKMGLNKRINFECSLQDRKESKWEFNENKFW